VRRACDTRLDVLTLTSNTVVQNQMKFSLISSVFIVYAKLELASSLEFATALPMWAMQRMSAIECEPLDDDDPLPV
jgi:hypothetical protein